jgi:uncharacterized protein (TIGR03437 family)
LAFPIRSSPYLRPIRASLSGQILTFILLVLLVVVANAEIVPQGFVDEQVAAIGSPTAIAFTPDGRMLVTTQPGALRVVLLNSQAAQAGQLADTQVARAGTVNGPAEGDQLLATPALQIAANRICSNSERGLLGVAVDPQFATNQYIYLYYTFRRPGGDCGQRTATTPVNRVSRFVLPASNVIDAATETVLIDNIPSYNGNHNGGDVQFGRDGYLYVSVGDSGCDPVGDSGCAGANDAARDVNTLSGKVLRITKDGGIPAENPWQGAGTARCSTGAAAAGVRCQEVFAWGLRNPFRLAFDPNAAGTRFFILDVGQDVWEEINEARAGADYGWNLREGACANGSTTNCPPPPAGVTDPLFAYRHGLTVPGTQSSGCDSIAGGAVVPAGVWPKEFDGTLLFADFVCGSILRLGLSGSPTAADFARGLGGSSVVHLRFGPWRETQALYYTTYAGGGAVRRVYWNGAPVTETLSVVSAASLAGGSAVAAAGIATAYGEGLSAGTEGVVAPVETLAGTTVLVRDAAGVERAARLYLASPGQVNFVVPAGTAAGRATVVVSRSGVTAGVGSVMVDAVAPSVFAANANGQGPAAAYAERIRGSLRFVVDLIQCPAGAGSCVALPLDLGPTTDEVYLSLFGTGIRGRSSLGAVRVTAGGTPLEVLYAGPQGQYPGMDQLNVRLPGSLAGRGTLELQVTVDGRVSNVVTLTVR